MPKKVNAGDILMGKVTYCNLDSTFPGSKTEPDGFDIIYTVEAHQEPAESSTPKTVEEINELILKTKMEKLSETVGTDKFASQYQAMADEYPDHLPIYIARLRNVSHEGEGDAVKTKEAQVTPFHIQKTLFMELRVQIERSREVIAISEDIAKRVNQNELAVYFGTNHENEGAAESKEHKTKLEEKTSLIEAFTRRAMAYYKLYTLSTVQEELRETEREFYFYSVRDLHKWSNVEDEANTILIINRDTIRRRFGAILKILNKVIKEGNGITNSVTDDLNITVNKAFLLRKKIAMIHGWSHIAELDDLNAKFSEMKDFRPF